MVTEEVEAGWAVEVSAEAETETEHRVLMEPAVAVVVQMVLQEPLTTVEKVAMV